MADITSSLIGGLLPRLGMHKALSGGFQKWMSTGLFHVKGAFDANGIELQITDVDTFVRYISWDFERFSLASRESLKLAYLEKRCHSLSSWPLLKIYYSGFFAAHAILRSQGGGVSKIENSHIAHINSILSISHPSIQPLKPGIYFYRLNKSAPSRSPSLIIEPMRKDGGVHETFWKAFCDYLEEESKIAVSRGDIDAGNYAAGVIDLTEAIIKGAGGVWLSSVRNDINYQQAYDTWYPLKKSSEALKAIDVEGFASPGSIRMDIAKNKNPLTAFANISRHISSLSNNLSDHVAHQSTAGHAFGQKWRKMCQVL